MTENSTLNRLFPGATPESCGIPSQAILDFMDRFEQEGIELHSFSIFRGGRQIAAAHAKPFEAESLHRLQSAGKTVVGLAVRRPGEPLHGGEGDVHQAASPGAAVSAPRFSAAWASARRR